MQTSSKGLWLGLAFGLVFLVGSAVGGAGLHLWGAAARADARGDRGGYRCRCEMGRPRTALAVPPVRAGTNPTRWEFKCFRARSDADIERQSNRLGAKGFAPSHTVRTGGRGAAPLLCFRRYLPGGRIPLFSGPAVDDPGLPTK